jgi:hypothetical protein
MIDRTFDWVPRYDAKSLNYPIRAVIGAPPERPKMWQPGVVLDQGQEGACVGFGWTGELIASPKPDPLVLPHTADVYARSIYRQAQTIDEWEGEDYSGTSVLAGAKIVQKLGMIESYRWAFTIEDVRDAVITTGPVVIGVPWYEGMAEPDEQNLMHPTGRLLGGHCVFIYEYHPSKRLPGDYWGRHRVFRIRNSWGPSWGVNGSAHVTYDDLAALLGRGEACVPMNRQRVRIGV